MGIDQAKRKVKGTTSCSSDIEQMKSKIDNLKATFKKYLSVAKKKEKSSNMTTSTRNTSNFIGCERELTLKAKDKIAKKYNI